jgi:hypothetical protein
MPIDFDNYQEVKDALTTGKGVYPDLPYFILSDGSVRDVLNHQHLPANALRADLCSAFAGFLSASAPDLTGFVEKLVDITDTAPDVEDYALGDRYFNTSDKKLYVLDAAADPEDPNAWAEADPNITTGKLYLVPTGENAGLYAFDGIDTLVILELTAITGLATEIAALAALTTEIETVAGDSADIATVAGLATDIETVAASPTALAALQDLSFVAEPLLNVSNLDSFTVYLTALAASAPDVGGFEVGDKYFDTTAKKFYVLTAGTPNTWEEDTPSTVTAGGKLYMVLTGATMGLYHFDGEDSLELL